MENKEKIIAPPSIRSDLQGNLSFLRIVGEFMELYVTNTGQVFLGMAQCFGDKSDDES